MSIKSDVVIIGCGIMGLSLAYKLKQKDKNVTITMIDKESECATHASGRNSGVLHAGFYYAADSLKAKFSRLGNIALREYCKEHGIPVHQSGKLVVTQNESDLSGLHELYRRGQVNQIELSLISAKEASEIEPYARTHELALYSPNTATIDPKLVCHSLKEELEKLGVTFFFDTPYLKKLSYDTISAGNHVFSASTFINTAGLYADKIAKDFNAGSDYTIVPFKGVYLGSKDSAVPIRTNIYPVPNLANPFLGVHFTKTPSGKVKIGPTALPAFWRENYKGLHGFQARELYDILKTNAHLFMTNKFNFRNLAYQEIKKLNAHVLRKMASGLVQGIDLSKFNKWEKPGIRAQLLDKRNHSLVQDFVVEKTGNSIHILNAVSPAFTCCFPFSEWVIENYV